MAIGSVVDNLSSVLPPEIAQRVDGLITILQAVGVFAIIYFAYIIVMGVINFKSKKRIKAIEEKVDMINRKLNKLLKKKG